MAKQSRNVANTELVGLSAGRLARWFRPEGSGWRISKALRELCVFSLHDLIGHPPLVRMDLVSCRNLLIYFKPGQQAELLRSFHFALNPGGLLLLGKAESAGLEGGGFESVDSAGKLYRSSALPVARPTRLVRSAVQPRPPLPKPPPLRRELLVEQSRRVMIDAYGPPAVLVDAGFEPVHFFGASRRYFALPAGSADFSVFAAVSAGAARRAQGAVLSHAPRAHRYPAGDWRAGLPGRWKRSRCIH